MQLPRRSVRSIQSLPSIYTAFPAHYKPVRTHSASTASESARSPDIEDGLEVVPLEHDSIRSAPFVSGYLDEKEVFISTQGLLEKPLPTIPRSLCARTWGRMTVKYRVLAVLALQAVVLLTVGVVLLTTNGKPPEKTESRSPGDIYTNSSPKISIKRGAFSVPIHFPQQQSSACLARANESRAWQCAFDTTLQLSVLPSLGDDEQPIMVTLGPPSTSNRSVHCGQQAPQIGPTVLMALNGTGDGSQYRFSTVYDRTVVLREEQLGQEKASFSPVQDQLKHTTFFQGQTLWRCTFKDTLLEGFIYTGGENDGVPGATNTTSGSSSALPYKLKLVETRTASESAPYCEKVVVGGDGELEVRDENVPLELASTNQGDTDASCHCQWVVK